MKEKITSIIIDDAQDARGKPEMLLNDLPAQS